MSVLTQPADMAPLTRAAALGFDSCRVARALPPRYGEEYRSWLREGAAGEMQWMERGAEKRCDPQQVLAGARSVIALRTPSVSPVAGGSIMIVVGAIDLNRPVNVSFPRARPFR